MDTVLPTPFSIFVASAALASAWMLGRELERKRLAPASFAARLLGPTALAAFLGAKLAGFAEQSLATGGARWEVLAQGSGHAFYGLLAFGLAALLVQASIARIPLLAFVDALAPALLLGYAIGRIGCHVAGDGCYGLPSSLPWAIAYPAGSVPTLERVHPTPLYESTLALLGLAWIWRLRARDFPAGCLFALALLAYGLERFGVEFLRRNPRHGPFSQAQWISLVLILAVPLFLLLRLRRWSWSAMARSAAALPLLLVLGACSRPLERIELQSGSSIQRSVAGLEILAEELAHEGRRARATGVVLRSSAAEERLREVIVTLYLDYDHDGRYDPKADVGMSHPLEIDAQGVARLPAWSAELSGPDGPSHLEFRALAGRRSWVLRVLEPR